LKTVQTDLYELNLAPKKCIEIWKIGVESFRGFIAGGTVIDNPAMTIPWWMSKAKGEKI